MSVGFQWLLFRLHKNPAFAQGILLVFQELFANYHEVSPLKRVLFFCNKIIGVSLQNSRS
uniref:Uncharacterized protein n=1 Tax=Lepeophtheirus salmonis TaxID=72036 RepID=A0A0K2TPG3_LEPSM